MLSIKFLVLSSGKIKGFEISGHADYENHGKDIVCAAVSSAVYMTVNTITDILNINADIKIDEKTGYLYMEIEEKYVNLCSDLLEGLKLHMLLLEESYFKNMKVSYLEV